MAIAKNATIASVEPDLGAPETYVRQVLDIMYRFKHDRPAVRIGTSGKGLYPCYRIVAENPDGTERILGAFNDNGTPFPTVEESSECWSTETMSLEDVAHTLGRIRSLRKARI